MPFLTPRSIAVHAALLAASLVVAQPPAGRAPVVSPHPVAPDTRLVQGAAAKPAALPYPAAPAPPFDTGSVPRALYESFGFSLFRDAVQHGSGNVFLSPASAGLALSMAYTGARGRTRDDMGRALGFEGMTPDAVAAANARFLESVRDQHDVELLIANALWAQQGEPVAPEFIAATRRDFGAEVQTLDLASPAALAAINGWAARNTNGRIPTILADQPDPSSVLVLTNAVYFKGKWAAKFDSANTRQRVFTHADGSRVERAMMTRTGEYAVASATHVAVLRMPYHGDRFSLYVLLPDSGAGLGAAYHVLNSASWDSLVTAGASLGGAPMAGRTRTVHVVLPRFTIRAGTTLNGALQRLGMASAFSSDADFGGMMSAGHDGDVSRTAPAGRRLAISDVRQQVFVEVTEEGTEAAAATSVTVRPTAVYVRPPAVEFVADHPFVAVLRDDRTGATLFIGQVADP